MKRPAAALLGCIAILLLLTVTGIASTLTVPTGTWQPMGSMLSARSGATAVLLEDHRVLIAGGDSGGGAVNSAEVFNADGSFSAVSAMGTPRAKHVAVALADGRVLVAGGESTGGGATNSAEIYDPAADGWTAVAGGMAEARSGATASLLKDGRVLIAGGQNGTTASGTVEIFDPGTGQFSFAGMMSSPRMGLASASLADGRVLITGGSNGSVPVASSDVFDPTTNAVSAGPAMTSPRQGHSATSLLDGRVLVAGGNNGSADMASAEIYDAGTGGFVPVASSLAAPRKDHAAMLLPNNNSVLMVGGTSLGNALNTAETFAPWTGAFAVTGAASVARQHQAVSALNEDGLLLMTGGTSAGTPVSSAELYGFATVKTDAADYAPGSVVTITGTGWQPGETVTLTLVESPLFDTHPVLTAVADGQGRITNTEFSPDEHDVGIRFFLTAVGSQSGTQAQNTFTDAISVNKIFPVGAQTPSTVQGGNSATYAVTVTFNGSGSACTATLGIGSPGLPSGVTAAFSPNPVPSSSGDSTLTLNTTAGLTPAASSTFQITAIGTGASGCNGSAQTNPAGTGGNAANPTLTVSKTDQTISFNALANKAFGDPDFAISATASSGLPVSFASLTTGVCTVSGSTVHLVSAGTCTIQASQSGNAFYNAALPVSQSFTVGKATPTIAWANPADITYGTALSATQLNAAASVPGTYVYTPAAGTVLNAGSGQTLHVDFTPTDTTNYGNASKDVTINVNKADAVITVTPYHVTYDGNAHTATGSAHGVESPTPVDLSALLHLGGTTHTNAGDYAADSWTFDGNTNYKATSGTVHDVIDQATAVITVTPYHVTYDGNAHTATGSAHGVESPTPADLTSLLHLTGTTHTNAGDYAADSWTFDGNTNYKASNGTVHDIIDQADAVIAVTAYHVTYDGNAHTAAGSAHGVESPTPADLTSLLHLSGTTHTNAGDYAADSWTFDGNVNYKAASGTVHDVIDQATAVITVTPYHVTYDGNAHTATGSAHGVETPAPVDLSGLLHLGGTTHTNAGDYAADTWTFDGNANYKAASGTVHDGIDKADAVISVTPYHVTYDGNTHTATGSAHGVESPTPMDLTSLLHLSGTTHTSAGDYATDGWTFDGNTNYKSASGTVHDAIDQADAVITVNAYHVTYDGNTHSATGSAHGVESPAPADLSGLLHLGGTAHTNAGDYPTDSWTFDGNTNYKAASGTVHDLIDQADAVITVNAYHVTYDTNAHTATGSAHGVETPTPADLTSLLHLGGTTHTNAGDFTDSWTFDGNVNYKAASGTVHDVIDKADALISVTPYAGTYTGTAHTATGTAKGIAGVDLSAGLNLSGTTHTDAGDYPADPWSFTGGTNYNDATGTVHDHLDKADPNITATGGTFAYDGNAHAGSATAFGVLGESLSPVNLAYKDSANNLLTTAPVNAGNYSVAARYAGDNNYNPKQSAAASLTISKADAHITVTGYSLTYDATAHTATGTATGVESPAPADLTSLLHLNGTSHTDAGDFTDTWTFDGSENYNATSGNVHDHIEQANAAVNVTGYSVTYNAAPHTATGTATGVGGVNLGAGFNFSGTSHTDAGDYPLDSWSFSGGVNYKDQSGTVHDHIDKSDASLAVTAYSVTYNGAPHTATGTATGVGAIDLSSGFNFTGTSHSDAGDYPNDPWSFAGGANYKDQSGTVHDHIDKAAVTATAGGGTATFDGTNKAPSNCAVTGAYTGDLTCTNNPASVGPNAGTTVIAAIVNGTGLGNYQISYVPGSFTIGKAASTTMVTFEAGPYVYRATAFTATAVATGPGGLSVPVTPVTYSGDCINVTAGGCTANASYGGDGNHNGSSGSLSIAITPATPMISVTGVNTAFDGNPHPATGTAKGIGGVTVPGSFAFVYTPGGSAVPTLPGVYSALGTFTSGSPNYTSGGSGTASINIGYGVCTAGAGGVILPPINSDGSSVYQRKGGSTIPVKFRVCAANGSAISNPAAVFAGTGGTLTMLSAVRGTINNINEADGTDIPDAAFRWDASGQQWIFNMATNNLSSGNTYLFRINLANGSIQFVVGLK